MKTYIILIAIASALLSSCGIPYRNERTDIHNSAVSTIDSLTDRYNCIDRILRSKRELYIAQGGSLIDINLKIDNNDLEKAQAILSVLKKERAQSLELAIKYGDQATEAEIRKEIADEEKKDKFEEEYKAKLDQ